MPFKTVGSGYSGQSIPEILAPSAVAGKCSIIRHPEHEAIEKDFINWRSEETICREFPLSVRSSIYRHAAAYKVRPQ